jgi:type I restriction enzyme S subunit
LPIHKTVTRVVAALRIRIRCNQGRCSSQLTTDELEKYVLQAGDLLFARRSLVAEGAGKCSVVIEVSEPTVFESSIIRVRPNEKLANSTFLYYLFNSSFGFHLLDSIRRELAVAGITGTDLVKLEIPLPDIKEQSAISHIIGTLDDKIELNHRINHTLESMAQALFKSWFVDFDPVVAKSEGRQPYGMNAEIAALFPSEFHKTDNDAFESIPTGCHLESLADIAKYENGLPLQKYRPEGNEFLPVIKIRELRQGFSDSNSEKASPNIKPSCVLDDGDIIFSWSGSLMIDLWCGGKGALNQHLFKVTSDKYPKWFYYYWTNYHLSDFQDIAEGKATTMGHIQRHHLESAKVVIPSDIIIKKANKVLKPMLDQIMKNRVQSRVLASMRDALLPKLLSGEIRVKVT